MSPSPDAGAVVEDEEEELDGGAVPWTVASASSGSLLAVGGTRNTPPARVPSDDDCSWLHAWRIASPEASPADERRKRRRDQP